MSTPEISVVMPAYNAGKYIAESIISVLNQSFTSWELIVVDDGSTDNTTEIVNTFLSNPRIILIRQTNKGVSAARNAGINAATGLFISFLDADDVYLSENLKIKYAAITADSSIDYVYSDILRCDAGLKNELIEKAPVLDALGGSVITWQPIEIPGFSSNIMLRHSVIKDKNIYFDTSLSNCADRYFKILLVSRFKGAYIPEPLAKYRNTPGSMSKNVALLEHDELYILDKIKEKNLIPGSRERKKVFAKVYLMLAGSWYRDAGKTGRALRFTFLALFTNPNVFFRILNKGLIVLFSTNKKYN